MWTQDLLKREVTRSQLLTDAIARGKEKQHEQNRSELKKAFIRNQKNKKKSEEEYLWR